MDDSSIEHPLLNGAIANAQKKIEGRNFEIRKQILEFDDVSNDQRLTVYELRNFYLDENDSEKLIFEYLDNYLEKTADKFLPEDQIGRWKFDDLEKSLVSTLSLAPDFSALGKDNLSFGAVMDFLNDFYQKEYLEKLGRLNEKNQNSNGKLLSKCWMHAGNGICKMWTLSEAILGSSLCPKKPHQ